MPDLPVVPLFALLAIIGFLRAGATYALARGVRGVADRRSELAARPSTRRGEALVARFGAPAVTLSFLTVGLQTAVQVAAGSLRMPLKRYLPSLALGALVWAGLYVTVGLAALEAIWGGRVWVPVALLFGVVVLLLTVRRLTPTRAVASGEPDDLEGRSRPDGRPHRP